MCTIFGYFPLKHCSWHLSELFCFLTNTDKKMQFRRVCTWHIIDDNSRTTALTHTILVSAESWKSGLSIDTKIVQIGAAVLEIRPIIFRFCWMWHICQWAINTGPSHNPPKWQETTVLNEELVQENFPEMSWTFNHQIWSLICTQWYVQSHIRSCAIWILSSLSESAS